MIVNGFEVDGEPRLVILLDQAMREVQRAFGQERRTGELRGSQYRLLSMVPRRGARRLTDLATIADMSKQALGEFVSVLVADGYLTVTPDPQDRRSKLVELTARGHAAVEDAHDDLARVDRLWAERLGVDRLEALEELLREVANIEVLGEPVGSGG